MRMKIKQKIVCGVIVLGMAGMLIGCGETKVISGEVENKDTLEIQPQEAGEAEKKAEEEGSHQSEASSSVTEQDYYFEYQGVKVEMDAEAEPLIEQLGEANSYFEAPSCAFQGIDKRYTYSGFELDTYPLDGKDYVSAVLIMDDSVTTPEGVSLGDPVEKIQEVYGTVGIQEGGMIVLKGTNMKLCFVIADDVISSIQYQSVVLDE